MGMVKLIFVRPAISLSFSMPSVIPRLVADKSSGDFDWIVNNGSTPSGGTGPNNSFEGLSYVYAEASNPNFPYKQASIISPCLNLSAYNNPVLNFWYHMYDGNSNNGINQISHGNMNLISDDKIVFAPELDIPMLFSSRVPNVASYLASSQSVPQPPL